MGEDLINEVRYEITYKDGYPHTPDIRTIYTLLEVPKAYEKLEMQFAPHKIDILAFQKKRYLS